LKASIGWPALGEVATSTVNRPVSSSRLLRTGVQSLQRAFIFFARKILDADIAPFDFAAGLLRAMDLQGDEAC